MPIFSVKRTELNSLCDVMSADVFGAVEVSYRTRNADCPVVSSCGKSEAFVCGFEKLVCIAFKAAIFAQICGIQLCVAENFAFACHSLLCNSSRFYNALAYFCGWFTVGSRTRKLVIRDGWKLYLNINSIKKRTADSGNVFANLIRSACAFVVAIAKISATARIHCRNEHK